MENEQENKKGQRNYTASYETYFGGVSMGCFEPDLLPTKDTYTFPARDDAEAITKAASYKVYNAVIKGRFTKETPELVRLLESREVDISKLEKRVKT